jgi:predicted MFS family arabinose efflux permease
MVFVAFAAFALLPLPIDALVFPKPTRDRSIRVREALSVIGQAAPRRTFLLLAVIFFFLGLVTVGYGAHLVPMLTDSGFAPSTAAAAVMMAGLTVVLSRVGIGWLVDNFHAPFVLAGVTLALALACTLLALPIFVVSLAIASVMFGIGAGAELDLLSFLVSRYWPSRSFGKIYGALFGIYSVGTGAGPVLFGVMFDRLGNYKTALAVAAAATVINAALCLGLLRYRKVQQSSSLSGAVPDEV